ncbi:NDP-hexose 2,3-dehydratase family protein [Streptomyces decoyicus]
MTPYAAPVTGPAPDPLRSRSDAVLPLRFARSVAAAEGAMLRTEDFPGWLAGRQRAQAITVRRIPFADLAGWSFERSTGNLVHRSGRFFTVEGLHVRTGEGVCPEWQQPIIKQSEIGILGILVKEFDGVLHFLMQAKMEPGNPNLLQLSPTVQATRSNYTKVHRGADVKYLEYFTQPSRGRALADVLQSEHGSWFYRKSNRNMIVETDEDPPLYEDFCWLTLGQIGELLRQDNVVNMDSRSVLACAPVGGERPWALHSDTELLSWFTAERSRHEVRADPIPLADVRGWVRGEEAIDHAQGRHFKVVAVDVAAASREVASWTQPLIEPHGLGVTAFLVRRIGDVPHVLAHARVEGGFLDTVELGPTVQYTPGNYAHLPPGHRPPFLDFVVSADPARIQYEAVHSEEGGRFLHAESRYLLIEVDETEVSLDPPPGYCWVTRGQLGELVRHGHYVNVQARTLLACLSAVPVQWRETR